MSDLTGEFQGIDMGSNDTMQSQSFEQDVAEASAQPIQTVIDNLKEDPVDPAPEADPAGDPNAEAQVDQAQAAPPPVVVPDPQAPPAWLPDLIKQTNGPANELFQMLRVQQENNQRIAAERAQLETLQREQTQRQAVRDLQRPRPPDYNNATPESIAVYAQQLAVFEAKCAREDAAMEMKQHLASIEDRFTKQAEAQQARDLKAESDRIGNYIDRSMEHFKANPETQFMNNKLAEDLFTARWWSANERAGQMVDPNIVMKQFRAELAAINGTAQTVQKRTEQATIDQNRRNEQAARGAPTQVRSGGTAPGPAKTADPFDKPWWETSAFGTRK